ncbi:c-type cytochrome domain-containing protein [Pseudomonas sp. MBLB4136]|uniref:c-type cytochrome domain-containing protein n=1 Tax=Pseudomonas sp. MBLB4136 TaxID=3451558 RepID=UPI003F74CAAB
MPKQPGSLLALGLLLSLLGASPSLAATEGAGTPAPEPKSTVDYRQVQAILIGRCAKCHAAQGLMGAAPEGYRLTSYSETLAHDERARVVPGVAEASELVRRIRGQSRPRMPYDGPPYLDSQEVALIVDWINQGARDAEGRRAPMPSGARVRLHGTLQAGWRLDDLALRLNAATRLQRSPKPGDYVQVRGRLLKDGSLLVERIRPLPR